MSDNKVYKYMTRKELAVAGDVCPRTLYNYIDSIWSTLEGYGCKKRKKLTPSGVRYICDNYGISL